MRSLLLGIFLLSLQCAAAQKRCAILSTKAFLGNKSAGPVHGITRTSDGGFIIHVQTNSTIANFNNSCLPDSLSNEDLFQKYDSAGTVVLWERCYNDAQFGYQRLFPLANSQFIACGQGNGPIIRKEAANKTVLWQKGYGGGTTGSVLTQALMQCADGGYLFACESYATGGDVGAHYGSPFTSDIFVIKVDSNGNKVWTRNMGGSYDDKVRGICLAPRGGCYIVGFTHSQDYDFTSNHNPNGSPHANGYVIRLDSTGNTVWSRCAGGTGGDDFLDACEDGKGGTFAIGETYSSDGDVRGYRVAGYQMVWLLNMDSTGKIIWNNCYGSTAQDAYQSPIAVSKQSKDGTFWIAAGSYKQGGDVDTAYGHGDTWVLHVNDTGMIINSRVLGSPNGGSNPNLITPIPNGAIVGGGYDGYGGTMPNAYWSNDNGGNGYLIRLSSSTLGIDGIQNPRASLIQVYPNPAHQCIQVRINDTQSGYLWITDISGRIVKDRIKTQANQKLVLDCANLSPGNYIVVYENAAGVSQQQKVTMQ